jgi:hypothetical protein
MRRPIREGLLHPIVHSIQVILGYIYHSSCRSLACPHFVGSSFLTPLCIVSRPLWRCGTCDGCIIKVAEPFFVWLGRQSILLEEDSAIVGVCSIWLLSSAAAFALCAQEHLFFGWLCCLAAARLAVSCASPFAQILRDRTKQQTPARSVAAQAAHWMVLHCHPCMCWFSRCISRLLFVVVLRDCSTTGCAAWRCTGLLCIMFAGVLAHPWADISMLYCRALP